MSTPSRRISRFDILSSFCLSDAASPGGSDFFDAQDVWENERNRVFREKSVGCLNETQVKLGSLVYTIGLFAEKGESYYLAEMEDFAEGPLALVKNYGLESRLATLGEGKDFFLDFKTYQLAHANTSWLFQSALTRREAEGMETIPAKDFDAAIFIRQVSKPKMPWTR